MQEQTNPGMETEQVQDDFWDSDDFFEQTNQEDAAPEAGDPMQQEEGADGENQPETPDSGENQPETPLQTIQVTYNGQDMDVPIPDARALIQKGMNYDHALAHVPERDFLNRLASASGKTVRQYMDEVESAMDQKQIRDLMAQGMSQQAAQQVFETRKQQQRTQSEMEELRAQIAAHQKERGRSEMLRDFFSRHTDLNPKDIPEAVLQAVGKGQDLESAYTAHQNKALQAQIDQLKAQLAAQESGRANAAKAVGSVAQSAPPRDEADEFLDAFMKG